MSNLLEINWINVSSLDTFCDEKNIKGFVSFLDNYYDSTLDGWPEHSYDQLREAHKQLVKLIYQAGYDLIDVEDFENN